MFARFRNRKKRQAYRAMLARWNADGGDAAFRFAYDPQPESIVLDLGGYEGQWASDLYARQRCRIHIFEPVSEFARSISARFERNPDIETHEFALGASSRSENLSMAGASSSSFKNKHGQTQVEFRDIADWLPQAGIAEVALMKINIEGGEYELLERMLDCELARKVANIQVQFHNFVPDADARMRRVQQRLRATHTPTWQYEYIWENWRRDDPSV